ncbi:MAG: hypothetical protein ACIAQF_11990 [Phycisphaerales bacterium JB065]
MPRSKLIRISASTLLLAMLSLSACSEKTKQTVTEVKRSFARRAVAGEVEVGSAGRLVAGDVDRTTFELLDVRFDIGGSDDQELLMHAERAELIVDPDEDTMRIRFHNVTSAVTEGGITEEPVLVTEPWTLSVDAIPD